MNEQKNELMKEWTNERMNKQKKEWTNKLKNGQKNKTNDREEKMEKDLWQMSGRRNSTPAVSNKSITAKTRSNGFQGTNKFYLL